MFLYRCASVSNISRALERHLTISFRAWRQTWSLWRLNHCPASRYIIINNRTNCLGPASIYIPALRAPTIELADWNMEFVWNIQLTWTTMTWRRSSLHIPYDLHNLISLIWKAFEIVTRGVMAQGRSCSPDSATSSPRRRGGEPIKGSKRGGSVVVIFFIIIIHVSSCIYAVGGGLRIWAKSPLQ